MMPFMAVRCLSCNNIDEYPRLDYDEIPYCSQCASTTSLVPATPPHKTPTWSTPSGQDDLSALFSNTLTLSDPPTPPPTTSINYSISQHYTHPTTLPSPPPPSHDSVAERERERAYIIYVLTSNLGSATSEHDLDVARSQGWLSAGEYDDAVAAHRQLVLQRAQAELEREERERREQLWARGGAALEEDCSAIRMLQVGNAQKRVDPVFRTAEWFNEYYGGGQAWEVEEEEEAGVGSVYAAAGGRLRPFDL